MIDFMGLKSFLFLNYGAQIYLGFQLVYLFGAMFFTYVQINILLELKKQKMTQSVTTKQCLKVSNKPLNRTKTSKRSSK